MEPLHIKPTADTPEVNFNVEEKKFEISGQCFPENAAAFFEPIMKWIEKYLQDPLDNTIIELKFDYLNTASSKLVTEMIYLLTKLFDQRKNLEIKWYYEDKDMDINNLGKDISFATAMDMEFIEIPTDEDENF
jgi:hypothetical protein